MSDTRFKKSRTITVRMDDPTVIDIELDDLTATIFAETGELILTYGVNQLVTKDATRPDRRCVWRCVYSARSSPFQHRGIESTPRTRDCQQPPKGLGSRRWTQNTKTWTSTCKPPPPPTVDNIQSHPPEQSHEALARRLQEAEEEIRRVQGLADDQQQRIETLEEERDDQQQRIKTLEEESKLQDQRINRLQQWIESTLGVPGPTSGS